MDWALFHSTGQQTLHMNNNLGRTTDAYDPLNKKPTKVKISSINATTKATGGNMTMATTKVEPWCAAPK
jgi:hypothetical protein